MNSEKLPKTSNFCGQNSSRIHIRIPFIRILRAAFREFFNNSESVNKKIDHLIFSRKTKSEFFMNLWLIWKSLLFFSSKAICKYYSRFFFRENMWWAGQIWLNLKKYMYIERKTLNVKCILNLKMLTSLTGLAISKWRKTPG